MNQFWRKNKYYLVGFIILAIVIIANLFPKGYVFGGGDTIQLINAKESFKTLFFDWNGMASPFYFIFFILDKVGFSNTSQLSFYLGIFIFGAYISFNIFCQMLLPKIKPIIRLVSSLFYALNVYTLYVFSANWGFSHFQFLYVFVPLLFALYFKLLTEKKNIFGILFILVLFLASSGFGNPAFALSFFIFIFISTVFMVIMGLIKLDKDLLIRLFFLSLFSFLINLYWIISVIPQMNSGVNEIFSSTVLDLNEWLVKSSNPIMNTWRMLHYSTDYFPNNFPYAAIEFTQKFFVFLTFIPIFVITWGTFQIKKINIYNRKYFLVFLGLLLFLVMMVARVRPPFEFINHFLYNLWGMNTMRGYDKMAIYVPFVLLALMAIVFDQLINEKNKKYVFVIMALILITPLPFFFGKIQQNMSYRFSHNRAQNKDYRRTKYSFLIKIPDEYYGIRGIINNDKEKFSVATLPYSHNDGSGIANYPKWKLYGADITKYLYNKNFIGANNTQFRGWYFAETFNENPENPDYIVKMLGLMNSKYIIFHKDAPGGFVEMSQCKMENLSQNGLIIKIADNDYFTLYKISDKYFIPYITWQSKNVDLEENLDSIESHFEEIKNDFTTADFKEINPKKFEVSLSNQNVPEELVLSEPFNDNWKAYLVSASGSEEEITDHFVARGYANGWRVRNELQGVKIIIEYYPERLMWKGVTISGLTVLFLLGYLINYYYVQKNTTKNVS